MTTPDARFLRNSDGFVDLQPSLYEEPLTGPGDYSHKSFVPEGPIYSFPKAERFATPLRSTFYSNFNSSPGQEIEFSGQKFRSSSAPVSSFKKFESKNFFQSPGPGSYEFRSTLFDRNLSFKGKHRYNHNNEVPGPGQYNLPIEKNSKFALLKDSRMKDCKSETALVEYVFKDYKTTTPAYSFGKRAENKIEDETPGPGSYFAGSTLYEGAFSIVGKRKEVNESMTPGPGSYNVSPGRTGFSYSISKPYSPPRVERSPGPGDYSIRSLPSGPKYSFGQKLESSSQLIQPFNFDNRDFANFPSTLSNRSPLLRGKPNYSYDNQVPGPGSYFPETLAGFKGFSYGKSTRIPDIEQTPGPGQYEQNPQPRCKSAEYSFSRSGRDQNWNIPDTPGPGTYENKNLDNKKVPTLRGKPQDLPISKTPGPGSYRLNNIFHSPSYTFGLKQENNFDNQVPGPNQYSYSSKSFNPSWTMQGRHNEKQVRSELSPGPGAYDPKMSQTSLSFSISGKREEKLDDTPGPGKYESKEYKTCGVSFGIKTSEKKDETPGPGAYETTHGRARSSNPSWTMAGRARMSISKDVSPGPGQYLIPSTNNKKSCTISKLGRNFSASNNPGPGQYDQKPAQDTPSYTQGRSSRIDFTKLRTNTPGPGAYNVLSDNNVSKGKFPVAERSLKFPKDASGPLYKIDLKPDGPHYSIQGKRSENKPTGVPGPGSYEISLKNKKATPAFTMGAKRDLFSKLNSRRTFTPVRSRNK